MFVDPAGRSLRAAAKEMKDFTCRFILFPEKWLAFPNSVPNLKWERVKFDAGIQISLPDKCGIYSFVLEPSVASHSAVGYLLYVGKTEKQSLRERCSNYLHETTNPKGRPLIQMMLERWSDFLWLHYAEVSDPKEVSQLEDDLIEAFIPPYNDDFPATIRKQVKVVYRC